MAFILIRAENDEKLLNSLADIERHAQLTINGKPKIIDVEDADRIAYNILKQKLRSKSQVAAIIMVKENSTKSIMQIRQIHPPAHLIVVSDEYKEFVNLRERFKKLRIFKGYYSPK
jgi:uncharacterized protein